MIKNFFKDILYSIPFGLKAADKEIMSNDAPSDANNLIVNDVIGQNRVAKSLLKGEVTEEVSELRYRMYKVLDESMNYRFKDGKTAKINRQNSKILFQKNEEIVSSIEDEFNRINNYGKKDFTVKLEYKEQNKYRNENYLRMIKFNRETDEISLYYSIYREQYNIVSVMFANALERAYKGEKNDSICNFKKIYFKTLNCSGEKDNVSYILNGTKFKEIEKTEEYFIVTYSVDSYDRIDEEEKYFNKEMENKYKFKLPKQRNISYDNSETLTKECELCGKKISQFEYDETKKATESGICFTCLTKLKKTIK